MESAIVDAIRKVWAKSAHCKQTPQIVSGIRINLQNPLKIAESGTLSNITCWGISNKTNMPTKFTLQVFVRRILGNFLGGIHSQFGTSLDFRSTKCCRWNPITFWNHSGIKEHKNVRLSRAQFGFVMFIKSCKWGGIVSLLNGLTSIHFHILFFLNRTSSKVL